MSSLITPKGLFQTGEIGTILSMYISNYKGGRNESFMYGLDRQTMWYDYDLTSAYTTVMAGIGHPNYPKGRRISVSELKKMTPREIVFSYLLIKAEFTFPDNVKYPSIPCFVDENTTVYPLSGECSLTGAEYLLAVNQKCDLKISDIYYIPFDLPPTAQQGRGVEMMHPFKSLIKEVQTKRREYKKGSINNLLYKEMGNSIYGNLVRGLGNKRKFDIKTGQRKRMEGSELSNPILAS